MQNSEARFFLRRRWQLLTLAALLAATDMAVASGSSVLLLVSKSRLDGRGGDTFDLHVLSRPIYNTAEGHM